MSQANISGKNQSLIAEWESVLNAGLFMAGSVAIGRARIVEWIKGPLTTEGMVLAALLNGVATISGSALAKKYQLNGPYYKGMIAVGSIAIGSFVTPYIASTLLANTVVQISIEGALAVGAANLMMRTTTYTLYKLYQYFVPVAPPKPSIITPQDVQNFSVSKLVQWHSDLGKNNNEEWAKLPIDIKMALNKEWHAKGPGTIHFTTLTQATPFSEEELKIIEAVHRDDRSKEYFLFLYSNNRSPAPGNYSEKELSLLPTPLAGGDVGTLSVEQIEWHHRSLCINSDKPQDGVRIAFANRFFAQNLKCPGQNFSLSLPHPADINAINRDLVSWYFYDFNRDEDKWKALTFAQQAAFNTRFIEELEKSLILYPRQVTDVEGAHPRLINTLHAEYKKNAYLWITLPLEIAIELNKNFKSKYLAEIFLLKNATEIGKLTRKELQLYHDAFTNNKILETRFTPEQYAAFQLRFIDKELPEVYLVNKEASTYVPTWKKVAVIGFCISLVALPLLAPVGVAFLGRSSEKPNDGICIGDHCNEQAPIEGPFVGPIDYRIDRPNSFSDDTNNTSFLNKNFTNQSNPECSLFEANKGQVAPLPLPAEVEVPNIDISQETPIGLFANPIDTLLGRQIDQIQVITLQSNTKNQTRLNRNNVTNSTYCTERKREPISEIINGQSASDISQSLLVKEDIEAPKTTFNAPYSTKSPAEIDPFVSPTNFEDFFVKEEAENNSCDAPYSAESQFVDETNQKNNSSDTSFPDYWYYGLGALILLGIIRESIRVFRKKTIPLQPTLKKTDSSKSLLQKQEEVVPTGNQEQQPDKPENQNVRIDFQDPPSENSNPPKTDNNSPNRRVPKEKIPQGLPAVLQLGKSKVEVPKRNGTPDDNPFRAPEVRKGLGANPVSANLGPQPLPKADQENPFLGMKMNPVIEILHLHPKPSSVPLQADLPPEENNPALPLANNQLQNPNSTLPQIPVREDSPPITSIQPPLSPPEAQKLPVVDVPLEINEDPQLLNDQDQGERIINKWENNGQLLASIIVHKNLKKPGSRTLLTKRRQRHLKGAGQTEKKIAALSQSSLFQSSLSSLGRSFRSNAPGIEKKQPIDPLEQSSYFYDDEEKECNFPLPLDLASQNQQSNVENQPQEEEPVALERKPSDPNVPRTWVPEKSLPPQIPGEEIAPQASLDLSIFGSAVMMEQLPPIQRAIVSESNRMVRASQCLIGDKHPWHERLHREILNGIIAHVWRKMPTRSRLGKYVNLANLYDGISCHIKSFPKGAYTDAVFAVIEVLLNPDKEMDAYTQRTTFLKNLSYAFEVTDGILPGNISGNIEYEKELKLDPFPKLLIELTRADVLQIISEGVFAGPDLHSFSKELIFTCIEGGREQIEKEKLPLSALIQNDFKTIREVVPFMKRPSSEVNTGKLKGHLNIGFNPNHDNNFASVLYYVDIVLLDGTKKEVACLRYGTPTKQGLMPGASALGEFEGFLYKLDRQNENYCYFNHQNPFPKTAGKGDETARIKALAELPAKHKNFFLFTLPLDGDFFNGKIANTKTVFQKEFTDSILENKNGIFIPYDQFVSRKIPAGNEDQGIKAEMETEIRMIISKVFRDYFPSIRRGDTMNAEQQTLFQYQTYKKLIRYFIVKSQAVAFNRTCKDGMDRGGIMNGGDFYDSLLENGLEQNQEAIDDFRVVLHSPAFEIKDQAIISGDEDKHDNRGNLLIKALKLVESLPSDAKDRIRKRKISGTKSWTVRCSPAISQEIYPTYGNAKNKIELEQARALDSKVTHTKELTVLKNTSAEACIGEFMTHIYKKYDETIMKIRSKKHQEDGKTYIITKILYFITISETKENLDVIAKAIWDESNNKVHLSIKRK